MNLDSGSERLLAAEAIIAVLVVYIGRIRQEGKLIPPSQVVGIVMAYGLLALVAMLGNHAARVASAIGALVLLTLLLRNGAPVISGISGLANPKAAGVKVTTTGATNANVTTSPTAGQLVLV